MKFFILVIKHNILLWISTLTMVYMSTVNVIENKRSKIEVTVFTSYNIDTLSTDDRKALLEIYQRAYMSSLDSLEISTGYDTNEEWFINAHEFYIEPVKDGNCEITLSKHGESGEIIAGLFSMNAKVLLENADQACKKHMHDLLNKIDACPEKTVYVSELFVNPEYRGAVGGLAIGKMVLELYEKMHKLGMKHVIAWTLDREDNPMIRLYKKIGLQEAIGGKIEKGIDVYKSAHNKKYEYTKSCDGPVVYFYGTDTQVSSFLEKFSYERAI